jgi:hypothetical protein
MRPYKTWRTCSYGMRLWRNLSLHKKHPGRRAAHVLARKASILHQAHRRMRAVYLVIEMLPIRRSRTSLPREEEKKLSSEMINNQAAGRTGQRSREYRKSLGIDSAQFAPWVFARTRDVKRETEKFYPPLESGLIALLFPRKSHVLGPRAATRASERAKEGVGT